MAAAAMPLPPGASLVNDQPPQGMKLPAGAKLVSDQANDATPATPQPSFLQQVGDTATDVAKGAGKGVVSTLHSGGQWLSDHVPFVKTADDAYWKMLGHPAPTEEQWNGWTEPTNTAQHVGKIGEQAAEFLIPGGAEEQAGRLVTKLAPKAPKLIAPLARTTAAAVGAGAVNKIQGGDFGSGALMGGIGGVAGEALRAVAPKVAESALGIRKADRFYGKTPGTAILEDTKGLTPGAVADSAHGKLGDLTSRLENMAATSTRPASLNPARQVLEDAIKQAQRQNNPKALVQLQPLADQLSKNVSTGLPLSPRQSAQGLLALKRGFGDVVGTWNPETTRGVSKIGKRAYRALDQEFDNAVPGADRLNQRISSLIPVAKRAESAENGAGIVQRAIHRGAAHTGAGLSGAIGGYNGYKEGGIPGAVAGTAAGFLIPEMLTSPTAQLGAARAMNSPVTRRVVRPVGQGLLLRAFRSRSDSSSNSQ